VISRNGRALEFEDYFGIRHRRFRDQLAALQREGGGRLTVERQSGEVRIDFAGDMRQAEQFAKSVPDFILKGRVIDRVRLDLAALEQEMGFTARERPVWWRRLLGGAR
jgi:hypothetical protein